MKPLTEQFADFCAAKPADERYPVTDFTVCALAQFIRASGIIHDELHPNGWEAGGVYHPYPDHMIEQALKGPFTFGALAARLTGAQP